MGGGGRDGPGVLCQAIFAAWKTLWGDGEAMKHASRLPPRCLSGRWGSMYQTEEFVLGAGPQLAATLQHAFGGHGAAPAAAAAEDVLEECPDELRVEAMQAYRQRLGQWRRDTLAAVEGESFWRMLRIIHLPHGILNNFLSWPQKPVDAEAEQGQGSHLAQLVDGKALRFAERLSGLVEDLSWLVEILQGCDGPTRATLHCAGILLCLHHAAAFHRRVVRPLDGCLWPGPPHLRHSTCARRSLHHSEQCS